MLRKKIRMPELTIFKDRTLEAPHCRHRRGADPQVDGGDCAGCVGGFGVYAGCFLGYDMLSLSNYQPDFATFAWLTLITGITPFGVRNRLLTFLRRSKADTKC